MKQFILSSILLCLLSPNVRAQHPAGSSEYSIRPIAIHTRWAKEVNSKKALPEYPRPQMARGNWTNLNGLWEYAITANADLAPDKYDGNILVPYPVESALSGVKKTLDQKNVLWYKKNFVRPLLKRGERLMLNFGAVSWEATVYINSKQAGHHTGSYTAFSIDITDFINQGDNEIIVKTSNPLEKGIGPRGKQTSNPNKIWYTPSSGIWQTVWLEIVPAAYIKSIKITPDLDRSAVIFKVESSSNGGVSIKIGGKTIQGYSNSEIVVPMDKPKLWSPDQPYLYDASITFGSDVVKAYFGMRKIEIKKDSNGIDRIYLNNKYTYNLGVLDQGYWPDGLYTAPTDEALKFDIEASKGMGFNTIRKHIKVEPARWYYHADKLGMLVWQDLVQPAVPLTTDGKAQFERESAEILLQLHNYPSITTWVLFNENWGAYDQERLTNWVKDSDSSRLVNGHSGAAIVNGELTDRHIKEVISKSVNSDMTDVHSYPPPAMPNYANGKAMVLGEFGGIGVQIQGHLWDDIEAGWGYGANVSAGTMRKNYAVMTDSLIAFEKRGLSASIYTQPFDVESEQNGLMTYDREILKIPVREIRNFNAKLWPTTLNYLTTTKNFTAKVADTAKKDFVSAFKEYKGGKKDSASLRALALFGFAEKDSVSKWGRTFANEYIKQIKDPFTETNLRFISHFLRNSRDAGFPIFYNNIKKVNEILGKDAAEGKITAAIKVTEITPHENSGNPDWEEIEKRVILKYGQLGEEVVWQSKVLYAANYRQWNLFEMYLMPWFEKYGSKRSYIKAGLLNNLAWSAFEQINNTETLKAITKVTAHALTLETAPDILDTHANLLYKIGRKEEAILWQQKAIALSPNETALQETLSKMQVGTPTWPSK